MTLRGVTCVWVRCLVMLSFILLLFGMVFVQVARQNNVCIAHTFALRCACWYSYVGVGLSLGSWTKH